MSKLSAVSLPLSLPQAPAAMVRADGVRGRERPGAPPPDPRGDEGWVRGGDGEG